MRALPQYSATGKRRLFNSMLVSLALGLSAVLVLGLGVAQAASPAPPEPYLVKDIYAGSTGSYPGQPANVNGTLFFQVDDGFYGLELWALVTNTEVFTYLPMILKSS